MDSPDPNLVALALADQALDSISRRIVLDDNEGDQLAFTDDMVALESGKEYVRSNSEHWNEPVQDVVNDDLNLAERYFFVCDHPHARNYQQFYPRDYLHTSASLMIDQFDIVAKDDPVMAWFLNTAEGIAKHQRAMHLYNRINHIPYTGPIPPEGVNLKRLDREAIPNTFDVKDNQFNIELPKGKVRTINPRVILNGGGSTTPLSVIHPEYIDYATQQQQWIGDYQASIAIEDPKLAEQIKRALDRIRLSWRNALDRPFMPPSELQRIIQNANSHVRKIGAISLNSANGLRYK
jgi:hypothetical protein